MRIYRTVLAAEVRLAFEEIRLEVLGNTARVRDVVVRREPWFATGFELVGGETSDNRKKQEGVAATPLSSCSRVCHEWCVNA